MAILVEGLVRKGWLQRTSDEKDRRANCLRLTPKGTARRKQVRDFMQVLRRKMMADITEEEANRVAVLKRVWGNLDES